MLLIKEDPIRLPKDVMPDGTLLLDLLVKNNFCALKFKYKKYLEKSKCPQARTALLKAVLASSNGIFKIWNLI